MEDNPNFNAGHGSVLNELNQVECDAMIMEGTTLNSGLRIKLKNNRGKIIEY